MFSDKLNPLKDKISSFQQKRKHKALAVLGMMQFKTVKSLLNLVTGNSQSHTGIKLEIKLHLRKYANFQEILQFSLFY